ncbi:MAG TPA: hypothetical protein VKZ79_19795 [Alphaproteobacteria bacterium]|nr:hypothetical protein [Alphaproteobacteria bacterium]
MFDRLARGALFTAAVGLVSWAGSAAAETKSFVVSYFYDANWSDGKTDCPDGTNLSAIDFYRRDLARLGHSHEEIEAALKDFPGEGGLTQPWVPLVITRGNGKDNVYQHPETAPDPGLKTVQGKYAYGFNLDGKGAASPNSFVEDPDTHEKGVNNQLYRVMGCIRSYRGLPEPGRPSLPENLWDVMRDVAPAWLITISSPGSLSQDGDVTISIDRATDRITRDASGTAAQADMSYQIDPDSRSHNELKGHIHNGVVTTTEPGNVHIVFDPYLMPELDLSRAKMRIEIKPDGTAWALLGGYQPWKIVYYSMANQGHIKEYAASIDVPALYYALKKYADAEPDPKTGENTAISSAYRIEAVPAFVVQPNANANKTAAADQVGAQTQSR